MSMEVRYIVFTPDEARNAIIAFVLKQGVAATANDIAEVELTGEDAEPCATVQLRTPSSAKPTILNAQYLVAALLLYCCEHRIPVPKRAGKVVALSLHGLTLVLTTDTLDGSPLIAANLVTYGAIANRATQEISSTREELARALARADYAESMIAQAEACARRTESARARSTALLIRIGLMPGLRGRIGRWLVRYRDPNSDATA
ncbi:MAG TPA: hypothetical protein VHT74_32735 [Acetobacteraceae bacterium]|nr:hypothetical protein [Acetobacteraceae bacterium]